MRKIQKTHSPKELQVFNKKNPNASYEDLCDYTIIDKEDNSNPTQLKNILQEALAKEQGYICCYCLQSIRNEGALEMVIEHFKPKGIHDGNNGQLDLRTDYSNLLAACSKKKNKDGKKEKGTGHCDVYKAEKEFQYLNNPSGTSFKDQKRNFHYNVRGKVFCKDENLNKEIGGILKEDDKVEEGIINLNHPHLINKRIGVWNSISRKFKKAAKTERWEQKRKELLPLARELRNEYENPKKDKSLHPFCEMVVHLLEKKFRELKQS